MKFSGDSEELDQGIRQTVLWLNENGFNTTDSGDGVSKLAAGWPPEEVLDFAHVFMFCNSTDLISEAQRLLKLLSSVGIESRPNMVEASYDPANESAMIMLQGVDDSYLPRG